MSTLVTKKAPDFCVAAVDPNGQIINQFKLHDAIKNKYALIFFYPLDFTFVCPSELIALDHRMNDFKERNVEVIAVSVDSQFTHNAWRNTPIEKGGIGKVHYTLAADVQHTICQAYGVEHPEAGVAFRGAFIIDRNGIVRSQIVNDLPIGRNIDELLRIVDALQFTEEHGEVCPAGWQKGAPGMKATIDGVARYLADNADKL
ncbi:MAG: peroxiredoxin [Gammaproteobacteria bacterium]|nr:peroxiredoxin [Gammaproteobacteria bacterium]